MELSQPNNQKIDENIIYIADDDSDFLNLIGKVLTSHGAKITKFKNGKDLMVQTNLTKPDAILLDINMPVLNGFDTVRQLKQQETTLKIPVIFISGAIDDFNVFSAYELGAIDYIKKPFGTKELLCRVSTAIAHAKNMELLEKKREDLARFNKAMVDREGRLIELKQEVNELLLSQGLNEKYTIRQ
jgi:DNA-binding response OmpR family regulator